MGDHRAERRVSRPADPALRPVGGKRKAVKPTRLDRHPLTGLPTLPTVAGAVAVTAAAAGAYSAGVSEAAAADVPAGGAQVAAPAFSQFDTMGVTGLNDRQRAMSRDADRLAARDAANDKLVDDVNAQANQRNAALAGVSKSAQKQASKLMSNRWFLPATGYHLTARFGSAGGLWSRNHTGLDFAAPTGTPVVAVASGTITFAGWDGSYGIRTVELLPDGTEIWYAHQSATNVKVGDKVTGGEEIGKIGSTGNSTGPHVHVEVRPDGGDPIDPYTAMIYHGLKP